MISFLYNCKGNEHIQRKTIEKTMNIEESFTKTLKKTIKTNDTLKNNRKKQKKQKKQWFQKVFAITLKSI